MRRSSSETLSGQEAQLLVSASTSSPERDRYRLPTPPWLKRIQAQAPTDPSTTNSIFRLLPLCVGFLPTPIQTPPPPNFTPFGVPQPEEEAHIPFPHHGTSHTRGRLSQRSPAGPGCPVSPAPGTALTLYPRGDSANSSPLWPLENVP